MSQTTLTTFFNSRKRPATDDLANSKNKIAHIERNAVDGVKIDRKRALPTNIINNNLKLQSQPINKSKIDIVKKTVSTEQPSISNNLPEQSKNLGTFAKKGNITNIVRNEESKHQTVSLARKELSLGDIKKKLASSGRLAELRATADRLSKGIQQLKESTEKKNLKEFKSIDVDVPQR